MTDVYFYVIGHSCQSVSMVLTHGECLELRTDFSRTIIQFFFSFDTYHDDISVLQHKR